MLVRDENGEPVRRWITRDRYGRFRTPLLTFVWADDPELAVQVQVPPRQRETSAPDRVARQHPAR